MKRYLLMLAFLACAAPAAAETWEWVDAQGTINFTDDLQKVPAAYRKKAKQLGDFSLPPQQPAPLPAAPAATAGKEPPPAPAAPAPAQPVTRQDTYGGKPAEEWRKAFSTLNAEIRGVDGNLKEKQKLLKEPGTLTRSDYLKLEDEIRRLSSNLTALLANWELLNKEATAAQVPMDLRH